MRPTTHRLAASVSGSRKSLLVRSECLFNREKIVQLVAKKKKRFTLTGNSEALKPEPKRLEMEMEIRQLVYEHTSGRIKEVSSAIFHIHIRKKAGRVYE